MVKRVLFLCTGNACRSQMAEGWARHLHAADIEAYSAGVKPHGLDSRAVKVMQEAGVDISQHRSNHVDELLSIDFDVVITVCDAAAETCPVFPRQVPMLHYGFPDPPSLAEDSKTEADALLHYRRVRDEIRAFIETLPDNTLLSTT
ncbi:MAG TPA: arsenate reductase ArsC [Gammaproteobacteria bacterium]|nr:arsenate reductase ArsC [Gammaproteobacteria bacterium]